MTSITLVKDSRTFPYLKELCRREISVIDTHTFWTHQPCSRRTKIYATRPETLNSCLGDLGIYAIGIPMNIYQNGISPEVVVNHNRIVATCLHFNPNPAYAEQLGYAPPEDLEETARDTRVVGLKTLPSLSHTPVDDSKNNPFFEVAIKHGLPVLVHCSREGNEFSDVKQFGRLLERYPELEIIMAHFGGLRTEYMRAAVNFAEKNPNVCLNTTALNPFRPNPYISNKSYGRFDRALPSREFFEEVLKIFTDAAERIPDQIVFGTDFGATFVDSYSLWPIYELRDPELESKILFKNPLKIFSRLRLSKNLPGSLRQYDPMI